MSRVIKFRAWHKANKQMLHEGYNGDVFVTTGQLFGYGDSVELMQFTGLLDKNGKEIYEGDIVKIVGDAPLDDSICAVEYSELSAMFVRRLDKKHSIALAFRDRQDTEVVGNVFEEQKCLHTYCEKKFGHIDPHTNEENGFCGMCNTVIGSTDGGCPHCEKYR